MTVRLVMCAGGRAANPVAAIRSALPLVTSYTIIDTGISRATRKAVEKAVRRIDGDIIDHPFDGSGASFTRALNAAQGHADWLLHIHADETAAVHPDMREFLSADRDPHIDAYMVNIANPGLTHQLPRVLRGNLAWTYTGDAHEWLHVDRSRTRPLNAESLTLHHHGSSDPQKFVDTLERLRPGYEANEPRAVFYTAESLKDLGRTAEAITVYRQRAAMTNGWDQERWYAAYQAAKLSADVEELLFVHRQRPWRHEPLTAAAKLIGAQAHDDVLFLETP